MISLPSAEALADVPKAACLTANVSAQQLRKDGKLSAARVQLQTCADPTCPRMVREDCTLRVDEIERATPTVAFEVKDVAGGFLSDVKVTVDGVPLADRLTGTALPVDPGPHVFTFTAAGQPPVRKTLFLTEGEKGRRESIILRAVRAGEIGTTPPEASRRKLLGVVAGGVGVAGLVMGGIFAGLAVSSYDAAANGCPSHLGCSQQVLHDRSNATTLGTVSTVGVVAGAVLLAGGLTLFLTAPKSATPVVGLQVTAGRLVVVGRF